MDLPIYSSNFHRYFVNADFIISTYHRVSVTEHISAVGDCHYSRTALSIRGYCTISLYARYSNSVDAIDISIKRTAVSGYNSSISSSEYKNGSFTFTALANEYNCLSLKFLIHKFLERTTQETFMIMVR